MFNKKIRENNRKLRQRVCELEETCKNIEELIDYKNECIEELKRKLSESEYREKIWEKERLELNNIISNLMEEKNKLTAKKIRSAKLRKQNTSKN